eukprot:scaffold309579_cov30-Prasinocladus_malaysianus.AAC.1
MATRATGLLGGGKKTPVVAQMASLGLMMAACFCSSVVSAATRPDDVATVGWRGLVDHNTSKYILGVRKRRLYYE